MTTRHAATVLALGLALASAATPASAITLEGDDIVVVDRSPSDILRVDPVSGFQTIVSSGGALGGPSEIAIESDGKILVNSGFPSEIIRVDPVTGAQTTVSSGGDIVSIAGIALEADGDIVVADASRRAVIRVDPISGAQTVVSSRGVFASLRDIAVEADGNILVVDYSRVAVIRVDPLTGVQSVVTSGRLLVGPVALAVEGSGNIVVLDQDAKAVIAVDLATGVQTVVSSGGNFVFPNDIVLERNGNILVVDSELKALIRVDRESGAQTAVAIGGSLVSPRAAAVVPFSVPVLACAGFDGGDNAPVKVTEPRTIPLLAELLDGGISVRGGDLDAAPVAQVTFSSRPPAEPPTDLTEFLPPPIPRFADNPFHYVDAIEKWLHGLLTLKFSAPGSYTIRMVSGDDQEYVIDPTCAATYVVE